VETFNATFKPLASTCKFQADARPCDGFQSRIAEAVITLRRGSVSVGE
jgi:hypothetical protein